MKAEYTNNKLVVFGGVSAFIAALCCATPILVWPLAGIGLAGVVGYLDYALFPLLAVALSVTYIGVRQVRKRAASCEIAHDDCS